MTSREMTAVIRRFRRVGFETPPRTRTALAHHPIRYVVAGLRRVVPELQVRHPQSAGDDPAMSADPNQPRTKDQC